MRTELGEGNSEERRWMGKRIGGIRRLVGDWVQRRLLARVSTKKGKLYEKLNGAREVLEFGFGFGFGF